MITAEERKAICEAREFNDKLLQGIADYTVVQMKIIPIAAGFWKARIIRNLQVRRDVRIILMKIIFIWKEFMLVIIAAVPAGIAPKK